MQTHHVDLTSLTWGIILTTLTGLLALLVWTDTTLDLGVIMPALLICAGALVGVAALLRPTHPRTGPTGGPSDQ